MTDVSRRSALAAAAAFFGAALVGFKSSVAAAAVARTVQSRPDNFVTAGDVGIDTTGINDTTAALQAAMTAGLKVIFPSNAVCLISQGITMATGAAMVSPVGKMRLRAKTGVGGFVSKDNGVPRNGTDKNMVVCNAIDNVTIRNVRCETDGAQECVMHGIRLIGGFATDGYSLTGLEFSRFFSGCMVVLNSAGSAGTARRRFIQIDAASGSGITQGRAYGWVGLCQTTVVEIDNDISGAPSAPASIKIGTIRNILFTGQALTDFNQQTDGVNIVAQGVNSAKGFDVEIGAVDGVGEVVDCQGFSNNFHVGTVKNTYLDAIKILHGGSYNVVRVGSMENTGRSAVAVAGTNLGAPIVNDSVGNSIHVGTLINPGAYGIGPAAGYAVLFGTNLKYAPRRNTIRIDEVIGDGVNLDVVVQDGTADMHQDNTVYIGRASGYFVRSVSAPPGNVKVYYGQRCYTKMQLASNQSIATGTATKIAWATVVTDLEGIANVRNNGVTFKWPGLYSIQVAVRLDGAASGASDQYQLEIRRAAGGVVVQKGKIHFAPGKDETPVLNFRVSVNSDEVGNANGDYTVYFTQDTGVSKSISATANLTYLTVTRIG